MGRGSRSGESRDPLEFSRVKASQVLHRDVMKDDGTVGVKELILSMSDNESYVAFGMFRSKNPITLLEGFQSFLAFYGLDVLDR